MSQVLNKISFANLKNKKGDNTIEEPYLNLCVIKNL